MTYKEWFDTHSRKHHRIMQKLTELSDEEIIAYFRFENMVEKEPDFCPLYTKKEKCHEMEVLNCYLCACPYFLFNDKGLKKEGEQTLYSICSINAKEGKRFISDHAIHQDCGNCLLPHKESFIKKIFKRDWSEIMHKSKTSGH